MAVSLTATPLSADPVKSPLAVGPTLADLGSILLFPAANKAGSGFDASASSLATKAKLKINGIGRYHATMYAATLPAVQRALTVDDSLSVADLTPPFDSPTKARKITKVVGSDGFMLTSLDAETVNTAAGTVQVTATVQVFAANATDALKTLTVSGNAASAGTSDSMEGVEQRAIDNAAGKIVSSLSPGFNSNKSNSSVPVQASGKKMGGSNFLLIVLAGVLAGVIISGSHGSGGSSSSSSSTSTGGGGGPPSPPGVP